MNPSEKGPDPKDPHQARGEAPANKAASTRELERWQRRLLPFMTGTIVVSGLFFIIAGTLELRFINEQVTRQQGVNLEPTLRPLASFASAEEALPSVRMQVLALLEANSIERRYHQANALLLFTVLTRFLGFVTGMVLALVGAAFILGKLSEPESVLDAATVAGKWGLRSSSPGIVLSVLGTILMVTTIIHDFHVNVSDSPLYLPEHAVSEQTLPVPMDSVRISTKERAIVSETLQKLRAKAK